MQIYPHSEDATRHAIMQDHNIDVAMVSIDNATQYYLLIKLSKGPLDKENAVKLICKSLETNILINAQLIENKGSSLKYKLVESISNSVINSIRMLCKVWMFESKIDQEILCQN
jgi:hypothetical protein